VNVNDKLQFVVNEIISTEQTYVRRLRLLNKVTDLRTLERFDLQT